MQAGLFPYGFALAIAFGAQGAAAEPAKVLEQVVHLRPPSPGGSGADPDELPSTNASWNHDSGKLELAEGQSAPVEHEARWRGLSANCSYLAPKGDFLRENGTYDVIVHFHAGMMAEKQFRDTRLEAVFVSCGFGIGSGPYASAFADPTLFGRMLDSLSKDIGAIAHHPGAKPGHVGLASWSAGFAAVGKILGVARYYDRIDAVVLMDSLHSQYLAPNPHTAAQGAERVDLTMIEPLVRFARDASTGAGKTMVMSHSSIIPPDYASSAEATAALLGAIGVASHETDATNERGIHMYYRADAGQLHVQGFRGKGPREHFAHLYLIGEHLQSWVVPQWKRAATLAYTPDREQR